jgi:hypothetical protein
MALVNPNIAMSFRMPEFQPRNALAEYAQIQQIQGGQRQAEMADMQMEALRRDRDALSQIQAAIVAKGGPPDLAAAADAMIKSGKPEYLTQGMAIRQKLNDQAAFAAYEAEFRPKAPGAAPTGMDLPAGDQPATNGLMGRVSGVTTTPVPDAAPVNAMAPAPTASVNAMAGKPDVASLEARYRRVANINTPGAKAEADLLLKQIEAASKESRMYVVPGVGLVNPTGKVITPSVATPAAPTQLAKLQAERAALPPGDPRIAQYDALIRKEITPAAGTTITMVSERAEQSARGKLLVDQYDNISKAAGLAARTLPAIESNLSILNKGLDTGFGTDAKAAGARVLGALGVKDAEKFATDTQTFQSNAMSALMQKQLEQKGPQTESDAQRLEQIGAQLGKTKDANRFILDFAKEQLKRDIDQRNFYDRWYTKNKTYDGAENAWFNGEGGKSLFDRPALKKYAVGAASPAAQIPTAATPARAAPAPAAAPANVITNPQFPGFSIRKP